MLRNIRMIIAYDGTDFHGWQRQPELRTVQGCLEQAVRRVCQHQVVMIGAGRTDAGVHAVGQVANFFTPRDIPCRNLHNAVGSRLPKDMTLEDVRDVPLNFHATQSAVRKLYRYRIFASSRRPVGKLLQRCTYHFWHPLDLARLRAAASALTGTHDFTAFASSGNVRTHNVREVTRIEVFRSGDEVRIDVEGTGFLYNQVRNMVGTLLEAGRGHWPVERVREILDGRDRRQAGPTAPARGLSLQWVQYDLPSLRRAAETTTGEAARLAAEEFAARPLTAESPVMPPGMELDEEPGG